MRRGAAWALFTIGIAVGSLTDQQPPRAVPRSGDYWILAGDFHVHGAPGDGTLLPWALRREAMRAGLDVLAVTNHNTMFAARFARWWGAYFAGPFPLVIAGEEVTSPDYHLAAVGITQRVDWRQSAAAAIEAVHAQGGVAIAAHPSGKYWPGYDDRALALLDGAEAANSVDPISLQEYAAFRRRALGKNPDLAAIGSSDFHATAPMSHCRTYLFVTARTEAGVLDAIRTGRTVAEDHRGRMYGDPELVRLVEANRPQGRSDENRGWRRISATCAWLGALGLILFRRPGR